jgi:hypothetical protein
MKAILIFLALFSFNKHTHPEWATSDLTVKVITQDERPVFGATVVVYQGSKEISRTLTTTKGIAVFSLDKGTYHITASYIGYFTTEVRDFDVVDEKEQVQLVLESLSEMEKIIARDVGKSRKGVPMKTYDGASPMGDVAISSYSSPGTAGVINMAPDLPGSGQITAGEWNDLSNWKDWLDLLSEETFKSMATYWNINTSERYTVAVMNKNNKPLSGAKVELLDKKGKPIWETYSDLSGKAELWANVYETGESPDRISVTYDDASTTLRSIRQVEQGSMVVHLDVECQDATSMDIAFIVDATSSMSDEILFLQSELLDVINRVKKERNNIQWASVFYRDTEDAYLTKDHPFTSDEGKILQFIKDQGAEGGGDFPEDVSSAMEVGISGLSWRDDADVKLCFLLLDAPPHNNRASMAKYKTHVKTAAARGIKIIPITASGINRETEFLMKYTAMLTNGTYVFITDDSGIGEKHLDPVVKDYEVEKLNDLLVRLITSYSQRVDCSTDFKAPQKQVLSFYPNPSTNVLNVESTLAGDEFQIISTSGQVVKRLSVEQAGIHKIMVDDLISGSYILRWISDGQPVENYPILVIR